jgi:hypothetical protein
MTKGGRATGDRSTDTAPCVGCGLCCDGTLYSRTRAQPAEQARMIEHGLTLLKVEGRDYFRLPCPRHSCGRCTIYEDRFAQCRSFRCALLRRYQSGKLDLAQARFHVETAKNLSGVVSKRDSAAVMDRERRETQNRLAAEMRAGRGDSTGTVGERLLAIVALEEYLTRWFRNEPGSAAAREFVDEQA